MEWIDLNADIGEGIGDDEKILDYITSANIACGFHAGNPETIRKTVQWAIEKGVAIGAHPGFPDLEGFGRKEMKLSPMEVYDITVYQIGALQAFAIACGSHLHHVKPHGALYNMAARDVAFADAIAQAVFDVDSALILYGLSGSELVKAGARLGLKTASEVFADRGYQADGSLVSRSEPGALITDADVAARRLIKMLRTGKVSTINDTEIGIKAETVCLHGDSPDALVFAKVIKRKLEEEKVQLAAI